jgi:hypothetical protein
MGAQRHDTALTRRAGITKQVAGGMRDELACGQEVPRAGRTRMPT